MDASSRVGEARKPPSDSQRRLANPHKTKNPGDVGFPFKFCRFDLASWRNPLWRFPACSRRCMCSGNPRRERVGMERAGISRAPLWPPGGCISTGPKTAFPGRRSTSAVPHAEPGELLRKGRALPAGFAAALRCHGDPGRALDARTRAGAAIEAGDPDPYVAALGGTLDPGSARQVSAGERTQVGPGGVSGSRGLGVSGRPPSPPGPAPPAVLCGDSCYSVSNQPRPSPHTALLGFLSLSVAHVFSPQPPRVEPRFPRVWDRE